MNIDEVMELLFPDADEFQQIALREAMADARDVTWPPETPEDEEKYRRLGAIAWEAMT